MDLKKFISQAIQDIVGAVQDAQAKTSPGTVVPALVQSFDAVQHGISELQTLDFELTVRADERSGSEARLSVVAAVIGGKVKGESGKTGGHAATLKFKIPLRLPVSLNPDEEEG